jgi:hypothetical protein
MAGVLSKTEASFFRKLKQVFRELKQVFRELNFFLKLKKFFAKKLKRIFVFFIFSMNNKGGKFLAKTEGYQRSGRPLQQESGSTAPALRFFDNFNVRFQELYSQHFIFFVNYKWVSYKLKQACVLLYTRLKRLASDKDGSLLGPLVSYKENEVVVNTVRWACIKI